MGQPAAKEGDMIKGNCTHSVLVPVVPPPGSTAVPYSKFTFSGTINGGLSSNVRIQGKWAATKESTAKNSPEHALTDYLPKPAATSWLNAPDNKGTINKGSSSVKINGKAAARASDTAKICDELKTPGLVNASSTVSIGD